MDYPKIVYAIRHNRTNRVYVGSTTELWKRIRTHIYLLRNGKHKSKEMQEDFDKYGHNYSVFVLDEIRTRDERNKEFLWMDLLESRDPKYGYNKQDNSLPFDLNKLAELKVPRSFEGCYRNGPWDGIIEAVRNAPIFPFYEPDDHSVSEQKSDKTDSTG